VVPLVVENDVVQELDAQGFTCCFQLFCHGHIVFAGDEPASRMVVGHNDGGGPIRNGIGKYLPGMDLGLVDEADGDDSGGYDLVGAVQGNTKEMFLFPVGVMADQRKDIGWEGDLEPFGLDATAGKFQRCGDKGRLGRADTFDLLQFLEAGISVGLVHDLQYPICHPHDVVASSAAAKQDGHQLKVGQGPCPFISQFFTWTVQFRNVRNLFHNASSRTDGSPKNSVCTDYSVM
jgi:hypothetical protein